MKKDVIFKNRGFTMIELIMVIVIIAIIASVTLPKFVNFKTSAYNKTEDYIAGAMNTAIKAKYTQNIVQGSEPDNAWPSENPFSLLENPPPNIPFTTFNDNYNWRRKQEVDVYLIYCPHWSGTYSGLDFNPGSSPRGRGWVYMYYNYTSGWWYSAAGFRAGRFENRADYGH